MEKIKKGFFAHIKDDLPASLVVFLVAVPLCLGIALASGAPLFSGIIAGIVGGIVVTLFSGSPLGVSGPAAGLAVIVLSAINEIGSFEVFLYAVIVAGLIQVIMGFLRAGVIGYYFPSGVIKGMLTGIGIIIILKQIPHAFGHDEDFEGDQSFFQGDGHNTLTELAYVLDSISPGATVVAVISMIILILWERPFMKKHSLFKVIQGPLVVVLAGIGMNFLFMGHGTLAISHEHTVSIPVADSLSSFLGQFTFPDFSHWNDPKIYVLALTIAVVASLETLLCVEATDKLDPHKRITPTNRELLAQGIGNMVSGFIGGLPVTQVIVRSSANIQSGGQTKAASFFHGILMLLSALFIPYYLNMIPLASLAAILFMVGYKLAKPSLFKEMYRLGRSQFVPFMVTVLGIIFTDLLTGIGLGMAVGVIQILWDNYSLPYHFEDANYKPGDAVTIRLSENITFLNKAGIMRTLNQLPPGTKAVIDATRTKRIHPDIIEIIHDFSESAHERDITVELKGKLVDDLHDSVEHFQENVLSSGESKGDKGYLHSIMNS
ncbi:MAG: SulP family inorganic anion transporter [Bacteroidetes bacterium]|nr:SulP family inorganic anion transporter [Bacteroidota bacterium]MDA0972990.1 SulP family inorganic anion transporter [Bacteroidota bacterium]